MNVLVKVCAELLEQLDTKLEYMANSFCFDNMAYLGVGFASFFLYVLY